MKLTFRQYQTEDDFWRIRNFLRDVFMLNDRRRLSWPVARLDYWRWHGILKLGDGALERDVFLWETEDRHIAGVLNCEELGQAFLQIHPDMKTADMEEQMIRLAEEHLRTPSRRGGFVLWVWSDAGDSQRQGILTGQGFTHIADADEHQWQRSLEQPMGTAGD